MLAEGTFIIMVRLNTSNRKGMTAPVGLNGPAFLSRAEICPISSSNQEVFNCFDMVLHLVITVRRLQNIKE